MREVLSRFGALHRTIKDSLRRNVHLFPRKTFLPYPIDVLRVNGKHIDELEKDIANLCVLVPIANLQTKNNTSSFVTTNVLSFCSC